MISVIIPYLNERESLPILISQLHDVLNKMHEKYELIMVDDGSTDGSSDVIKNEAHVVQLRHRKKSGKGRALTTGFARARGDVIVFMDADLQDDPSDLPVFLAQIKQGYDFVNGWRQTRVDPLAKTLPSSIFNYFLLKKLLRSKYHDINCGFKVMKREVLEDIHLYGNNYRFLPVVADRHGFRCTEVVVNHHARQYGHSKYGFFRIFVGFFDTITTYFIYTFAEKPLQFFGPIGGVSFVAGSIITIWLTIERVFFGVELYKRPMLLAGIFMIIVGLQVIMTGIIAELIVYLDKSRKTPSRS